MSNLGEGSAREALLRIGELARRSGVPAATLRAWERRYGVVEPVRGDSGYRLYSSADERRVRSMRELVEAGVAPAEAAAQLRAGGVAAGTPAAAHGLGEEARRALLDALLLYDAAWADELLDRAFAAFTHDAALDGLVLPVLREIGELWSRGEASVAQEHFASALLRGRLLGLARGWGIGGGRLALLACPSGEHHDLGLIAFGLSLHQRGWRISFLGADTPGDALAAAAARLRPDVVVLYARDVGQLTAIGPELTAVAQGAGLLLAGPGAEPELSELLGAAVLRDGPVEAAESLAA